MSVRRPGPGPFPDVDTPPRPESFEDHFRSPRNPGGLEDLFECSRIPPGGGGEVEVENPVCGDRLKLAWKTSLPDEGEPRILGARFRVLGCPASIVCASVLTVLLEGKTAAELRQLDADRISSSIDGLDGHHHHAAVLAADAVQGLLRSLPGSGG